MQRKLIKVNLNNNTVSILDYRRLPKGACINPYRQTKSMLEDIMISIYTANVKFEAETSWNIVLLRYFNPIGAQVQV